MPSNSSCRLSEVLLSDSAIAALNSSDIGPASSPIVLRPHDRTGAHGNSYEPETIAYPFGDRIAAGAGQPLGRRRLFSNQWCAYGSSLNRSTSRYPAER